MPIFYLTPVYGHTDTPRWAATSLREGCWVVAETEDAARRKVGASTLKMVDYKPGAAKLVSPWLDPSLTDCWPDDKPGLIIPDGIIVTVSGKTISNSSSIVRAT